MRSDEGQRGTQEGTKDSKPIAKTKRKDLKPSEVRERIECVSGWRDAWMEGEKKGNDE